MRKEHKVEKGREGSEGQLDDSMLCKERTEHVEDSRSYYYDARLAHRHLCDFLFFFSSPQTKGLNGCEQPTLSYFFILWYSKLLLIQELQLEAAKVTKICADTQGIREWQPQSEDSSAASAPKEMTKRTSNHEEQQDSSRPRW